jgi:VWFA-related protein
MRGSAIVLSLALLAGAQQRPDAPADTPQTFRTGVDIVHVDVSVLDGNRRPVRGLTAADFTILEDGKPRPVVAFTPVEIPAPPANTFERATWLTDVAPDVADNDLPREGRLVVIMFDQTIRNAQRPLSRRIAKAAVDALGPADVAAIVHTGTGTPQNFTRDRLRLLAAIDAPMMGLADGEEWIGSTPESRGSSPGGSWQSDRRGQCPLGTCTLEAITRIAESLRNLPRRKSLLLIAPQVTIQEFDSGEVKRLRDQMFRALDVANLTIYPIDPGGLETLALDAARPSNSRPSPNRSPVAAGNLVRQGNLHVLADRTGGRTIVNANDPDTLVPAIFDESSAYYSLGFERARRAIDGTFHEIAVKVNRRNVAVHSRRGHYAGGTTPALDVSLAGPPADLVAAVSAGWPKTETRLALAAAAFTNPNGSRPFAAIAINTPDVKAKVGVLVAAFNKEGRSINHHWQVLDVSAVSGGGQPFEFLSRLPLEPGTYELRAAVSGTDGKPGSVYTYLDVPDFAKAPLSLSGIAIETIPAALSGPGNTFDGLLPIVPTARRTFAPSDTVGAFVRLYQGGAAPLEPAMLSATVQDARGRTVVAKGQTLAANAFGAARSTDYRLELPPDTFAEGDYLLSIVATAQKRTVRRDLRFSVKQR